MKWGRGRRGWWGRWDLKITEARHTHFWECREAGAIARYVYPETICNLVDIREAMCNC
jgi:hypothetical protein